MTSLTSNCDHQRGHSGPVVFTDEAESQQLKVLKAKESSARSSRNLLAFIVLVLVGALVAVSYFQQVLHERHMVQVAELEKRNAQLMRDIGSREKQYQMLQIEFETKVAELTHTIEQQEADIRSYSRYYPLEVRYEQILALSRDIEALLAEDSRSQAPESLRVYPRDPEPWIDAVLASLDDHITKLELHQAKVEAYPDPFDLNAFRASAQK